MTKRDYYHVIGVARDASHTEIKRAYRTLAMEHHPDRNPGDPKAQTRFRRAAEAYEVLSDPRRRQIYDQYGHEGLSGQPGGRGAPGFEDINDIFAEFGDLFGDMFGFGAASSTPQTDSGRSRRGADMRYDLELSFDEAVSGVTKTIAIAAHQRCPECDATGAAADSQPTACPTCNGQGQVEHTQGTFTLSSCCPRCGGSGQIIDQACAACAGSGIVEADRHVAVKVPAGVDQGTRLRLRGEGEAGCEDGDAGDLYVYVHVQPSDTFDRHDADLHYTVELSFIQAALGCLLQVPTLDEPTDVKFPAGTQYGDTRLLEDRGIQQVGSSGRGDLIIHADIRTPTDLDDRQRRLLEQVATHTSPTHKATTGHSPIEPSLEEVSGQTG